MSLLVAAWVWMLPETIAGELVLVEQRLGRGIRHRRYHGRRRHVRDARGAGAASLVALVGDVPEGLVSSVVDLGKEDGPPTSKPNVFCFSMLALPVSSKNGRAFSMSFCKNS